jgi:hypothetical protein
MKKVNWVIEDYIFDDYKSQLIHAIRCSGMNVIIYDDVDKSLSSILNNFKEDDIVICHTSLQDGHKVIKTPVYPGNFLTPNNYECFNYYGYFGNNLLNSNYLLMGLNDVMRNKERIFETFKTDAVFIRPSNGIKTFTGQLLKKETFETEFDTLVKSYGGVDMGTLILLAPKQSIEDEYRFIVVDGKVVSGSKYMDAESRDKWEAFYDQGCDRPDVFDFAVEMSNLYEPDKAYTIDICTLTNGDIKVMELNSFCCASMYGNDYRKVVDAVNTLCINEYNDVYGDYKETTL